MDDFFRRSPQALDYQPRTLSQLSTTSLQTSVKISICLHQNHRYLLVPRRLLTISPQPLSSPSPLQAVDITDDHLGHIPPGQVSIQLQPPTSSSMSSSQNDLDFLLTSPLFSTNASLESTVHFNAHKTTLACQISCITTPWQRRRARRKILTSTSSAARLM